MTPTNRRLRSTRAMALLIAALATVAFPLPATSDEAAPDATSDSKIRDLEARIAELEAALAALRSGGTPSGDVAELQRRLDLLAAELEKIRIGGAAAERKLESRHGLGPAASRVYGAAKGVSIGGYGEMLYENFDATDDSGSASGKTDRIDLLRGVFYFGYKFNDRIVFNSEVEYEHASTEDGGAVSLEFAYLDFLLNEHANVRAGMVLVPAGFLNELHEPPIFLGARRPDVERRILPSTWRENGVGVFGDAGPFSYRAYLLAGFDSEGFSAGDALREGRQSGARSSAEDLALTARFDWTGVPGLVVGAFGYTGDSAQGRRSPTSFLIDPNGAAVAPSTESFGARVTLWDLHAEFRARGLDLRGLYASGEIDDASRINDANALDGTDSVGSEFAGWYLQAGWDVLSLRRNASQSLIPYVRYEAFNTQDKVPSDAPLDRDASPSVNPTPFAADPANDVRVWTVGVAYKPIFNVTIKADWQNYENEADTGVDQINVAVGWLF